MVACDHTRQEKHMGSLVSIHSVEGEHLSLFCSTCRLSIGLPIRWHHGLRTSNCLIESAWVQVGFGRGAVACNFASLLGRLIAGTEPLKLEQAC